MKQSEQKKVFDPQAFIAGPLIIIDSDEEEKARKNKLKNQSSKMHDEDYSPTLTLVVNPMQTPEEKARRRAIIQQQIKKHTRDLPSEPVTIQQSRPKMKKNQLRPSQSTLKPPQPQHYRWLRVFQHIPYQALVLAEKHLEELPSNPKCQIQGQPQNSVRQHNRQQLTRCLILAIFELRASKEPKSQVEHNLCSQNYDIAQFCYKLASEIQITFFKKLCVTSSKRTSHQYRNQFIVIMRQLTDKNNLEFRRKIIKHEFPPNELAVANEDSLMCEKSKEEELERMRQFVRQNQIDPYANRQPEQEVYEPPHLQSFSSMRSMSSVEEKKEVRRPTKQQQLTTLKHELISKNKIICKKTYVSMVKSMSKINERIKGLKSKGFEGVEQLNVSFDL